jgi:hypothetical protein
MAMGDIEKSSLPERDYYCKSGNSVSIRQAVFEKLDENTLLTAKVLCSSLSLPYRGHKNIKNTMRYTQLVDIGEQDYIVKVAWTLEEAVKLLEGGFQYVCDYENGKIFRKPK